MCDNKPICGNRLVCGRFKSTGITFWIYSKLRRSFFKFKIYRKMIDKTNHNLYYFSYLLPTCFILMYEID